MSIARGRLITALDALITFELILMKKFFLFLLLAPAMLVQAADQISIAEFISNGNNGVTYQLRGEVQNISNTTYGNFDLKDETGSIYVYGLLTASGESKQFATLGVEEGDTLTLEGHYELYGTKNEVVGGKYISHVKPANAWVPVPISISEFIARNDGKRYILTGVVTKITSTQYGNLYIKEGSDSILVYGIPGFGNYDIEVGDTLTISGIYLYYNNTTHEVTSGQYISHVHPTPIVPIELLRVCAQNLENYYYNYTESSRPDYSDAEGFRAKTVKIVNAMLTIDADIYAFCEVEAKPIVLQQLADSMNAHAGVAGRYAAVEDGLNVATDTYDNAIKSGFIYRTDKVVTVGSNTAAVSGNGYYSHTMRIQTFRQLANNEKLIVSMNHFKAKDSSSDQGEAKRQGNADDLVNAVSYLSEDPDILILGDLNCEATEAPIQTIINAGFEEQLLKYDASAWSHCYGGGELIDHVLANATMAEQIVDAHVEHICACICNSAVSYEDSWSDHDPYVIEIELGKSSGPTALDKEQIEPMTRKEIRHGQLLIIRGGEAFTVTGQRVY